MSSFHHNHYFCLDAFSDLWTSLDVWSALKNIKSFLFSFKGFSIHSSIGEHVYLENKEQIFIGKNCIIEPGVYIKGPVYISDNCCIRHGAYIREHTLLAPSSVVGHASEIKHSILLEEAIASHFVYVGDSILGKKVNLGAGVRCANLRLDRKEVIVRDGDQKISTGLKKFGAVVGDFTQIGCNTVLNPGTLIQKNVVCYPNQNISGLIKAESKICGRDDHPVKKETIVS